MITMCPAGYHDNDFVATHALGPLINSIPLPQLSMLSASI